MLQKWSCNFHSKCENSIWTPINCHLRFVTLDRSRKYRPKPFLQWNECSFFQNICFQQPLRCYRNDLVISPVIVRKLLDYSLPLSFVTLDNARKNRPKSFLHWSGCLFFFQKFMFSTTCFPQNWSYYFHSNCHITLWTFIKFSLTFFTFDNTRKARPNYFFHWKVCLFLQKLVFSTDSWLIKKWSYISHQNCQKTSCSLTKSYSMSVKVGNMRKKWPKSFSAKR